MAAEPTSLAELLNEVADGLVPAQKWPQTLTEMVDAAVYELSRVLPPEQARDYARIAILAAARQIGGDRIYLPRGDGVTVALRDAMIWHEHRGGAEINVLARRYGLKRRQLFSILSQQRALRAVTR